MMTVNNSSLKIAYWNANSIQNKIHQLYNFLKQESIDIFCICETFLKSSSILHQHPDYYIYRNDRPDDQAKGGVMILVRREISHNLLPILKTKLIENIGIEINCQQRRFQLFSCYLPGGTTSQQINNYYLNDITLITRRRQSYCAVGDLNSKNGLWNCSRANLAGNLLHRKLNESDFFILHPTEHTYFPSDPNRVPSTIDLVITNGHHAFSTLSTHPLGSDHNIITFTIDFQDEVEFRSLYTRPCYREANWNIYENVIDTALINFDFNISNVTQTTHIDELITKLVELISNAERKAVPFKSPDRYSLILGPGTKELIKARAILERQYQRSPNEHLRRALKTEINRMTRNISKRINEIRNDNWSHRLKSVSNDENRKGLWQLAKFAKNRNRLIPPLKNGDDLAITGEEKSELLASTFANAHENPLHLEDSDFTNEVEDSINEFLNDSTTMDSIDMPDISEIESIIRKLKSSKSPGFDRINNRHIKHLPRKGILLLQLIILSCLRLSYFPDIWKIANIIAIKKPGKNPKDPKSYRPISLLSSLSKILEKVILKRLRKHTTDFNIIPPEQHGFTPGKSTTHQLKRVCTQIKFNLSIGKSTGMVLVDIERAFDRVWRSGLIKKMIAANYPKYLIRIINNFLRNRSFIVTSNGGRSTTKSIPYGVPQGSSLSPELYNIFTSDAPTPESCLRALFADDTAFLATSRVCADITRKLRDAVNLYLQYYTKWKISVNPEKFVAIFFTKRRTKEIPHRPLYIHSELRIPWSDTAKYLGLILDKKMTFGKHIDFVIDKTNKAMMLLYSLINRNSALSTDNKLLLYKVALRPIFTYGCPVYASAAITHQKKLQTIQNKLLKMCLNVHWRTSTELVHSMADIPTVFAFIERLSSRFHLNYIDQDEFF